MKKTMNTDHITRETLMELDEHDCIIIEADLKMVLRLLDTAAGLQTSSAASKTIRIISETVGNISCRLRGESHERIEETADH